MTPRWWVWPLVAAAVIDAALVARYQASPALAVNRAILRTVQGGGCQQAVLIRGSGADQLFMIDTWHRGSGVVDSTAQATFTPGAGLTPQSRASIVAGGEVDLTNLKRPVVTAAAGGMVGRYQQQVGQAASWLTGPCLPFANPFQSHLRRAGTIGAGNRRFTLYLGSVRYTRGAFQLFAQARVWLGVRTDGRMGFEVLRELAPGPNHTTISAVTVATLFQYPSTHIGASFAAQSVAKRETFYQSEYHRVLVTIAALAAKSA